MILFAIAWPKSSANVIRHHAYVLEVCRQMSCIIRSRRSNSTHRRHLTNFAAPGLTRGCITFWRYRTMSQTGRPRSRLRPERSPIPGQAREDGVRQVGSYGFRTPSPGSSPHSATPDAGSLAGTIANDQTQKTTVERAKGFEPSTPTLARLCSTPELRPLVRCARPCAFRWKCAFWLG